MERVPTAKAMILSFIDKGIAEPTFAPVYLTAKLSAVDAKSIQTDLSRAGESLWHGRAYHSRMKGDIHTYPTIDLTKFPWTGRESVMFESVRDGTLMSDMQQQLDEALASLPFQIRPVNDSRGLWRDSFKDEGDLNRYFYFELFCKSEIPEWITGLGSMRMSGSWYVFLPSPSPELDLILKISKLSRTKADLEKLANVPSDAITVKGIEIANLKQQIEEALRQIAA